MQVKLALAGVVGLFASACTVDEPGGDTVSETTSHVEANNGISLNGISLNGISLNGISLNGISLNGISLNGISLNGISLNGISLNGISLNGISLNGISLNGTALQGVVGAAMTGVLSDGSSMKLRIDGAEQGTGANSDVGLYQVSYEGLLGWQPLCGVDVGGQPVKALVVPGTWNLEAGVVGGGSYTPSDTLVTFACRGKTIAKCVELGYKPWNGHANQLASCVRLLRGDFCGNGVPYTVNGTTLNLYDNVGVQADTQAWGVEAEWTPAGARCISRKREYRFLLTAQTPTCLLDGSLRVNGLCGSTWNLGAVLMSELP